MSLRILRTRQMEKSGVSESLEKKKFGDENNNKIIRYELI